MNRDKDLICARLQILATEATGRSFSFEEGEAQRLNRSLDDIHYNLQQAEDMGLIEVGSKPLDGEWKILRITASGHDFLERCHTQNEAASSPVRQGGEIFTAKPTFMGMSVDLKELWRRVSSWWNNRR